MALMFETTSPTYNCSVGADGLTAEILRQQAGETADKKTPIGADTFYQTRAAEAEWVRDATSRRNLSDARCIHD
jgi:hypothetical protein